MSTNSSMWHMQIRHLLYLKQRGNRGHVCHVPFASLFHSNRSCKRSGSTSSTFNIAMLPWQWEPLCEGIKHNYELLNILLCSYCMPPQHSPSQNHAKMWEITTFVFVRSYFMFYIAKRDAIKVWSPLIMNYEKQHFYHKPLFLKTRWDSQK